MTLLLDRPGAPGAPILLAYHVGGAHLMPHVPRSWRVWIDSGGHYAGGRGLGDVELARAASGDPQAPLVLVGWSAGCQAVRELLRAGAAPAAVVALDGTSGDWPGPSEAQMAPWGELATRARAGEALAVMTCTRQVYTELLRLPSARPFASTLRVVSALWAQTHPLDTELLAVGDYDDGRLRVEVHDSRACDAEAHVREIGEHGPRILSEIVVPYVESLS